jgi:hypothetical protein
MAESHQNTGKILVSIYSLFKHSQSCFPSSPSLTTHNLFKRLRSALKWLQMLLTRLRHCLTVFCKLCEYCRQDRIIGRRLKDGKGQIPSVLSFSTIQVLSRVIYFMQANNGGYSLVFLRLLIFCS